MKTDPTPYPTVKLGAEIFEIKFRAGDVVRLKKEHNIDLMSGEGFVFKGAEALEQAALLLEYGIAHDSRHKSTEEILNLVELDQWAELFVAVKSAQKKAADRAAAVIKQAMDDGILPRPAPPTVETTPLSGSTPGPVQ